MSDREEQVQKAFNTAASLIQTGAVKIKNGVVWTWKHEKTQLALAFAKAQTIRAAQTVKSYFTSGTAEKHARFTAKKVSEATNAAVKAVKQGIEKNKVK